MLWANLSDPINELDCMFLSQLTHMAALPRRNIGVKTNKGLYLYRGIHLCGSSSNHSEDVF